MKTFNRRTLLRGLGGAVVAAPFLPSVAEQEARAQSTPAPKRLIVFYTHYGCLTTRWFPKTSHGPLTTADYMAMNTLKPLAPYADKLLMVRGLRSMNEWNNALPSSNAAAQGQWNDPHTQVNGSFFTCHPVTPDADSGFDTSDPSGTNPKQAAKPTGRSLDHVCAEQVNPNGAKPLFIEVGGVSGGATNTMHLLSWDQPQQFFAGITSPSQMYNSIAMLPGFKGGAVGQDTYKIARGKSIIDCVRDDLTRYKNLRMSSADLRRVNDWADLLSTTTTTVMGGMCSEASAINPTGLNLTSTRLTEASKTGTQIDIDKTVKTFMDLTVLTAMCDTNRVIFLKMPGNFKYSNLGLTLESHSVSHRTGNANQGGTCVANALDMVHTIDKYYAELFAYFVGRLNAFSEGDKTVLDNTATVWFQEMSDGNAHNLNNMPILQAGSCGGYFKTGWAINVEGAKTDLTQGNSDGDCVGMNSPSNKLDSLGTPPDQATRPVNKYFCNLMNAIGVKAGTDGYPMKGGSAPVSKFGKYDDSKLFKPGTAASVIASPGEFTELKA
jgi:hypothetical protein